GDARARAAASRARLAANAGMADAVGAVPVDRQHRPDVLRLRLGIAAAGSWLPGDLPWSGEQRAPNHDAVAAALAAVPRRVRSWTDQDPPRSLLAQPDVSVLPPPNAAHAQPAQLVLPPPAKTDSQAGSAGQSCRPTRGAIRTLCATTGRGSVRTHRRPPPGLADPVRQLRLAELVDTRHRARRVRRSPVGSGVARPARGSGVASRLVHG